MDEYNQTNQEAQNPDEEKYTSIAPEYYTNHGQNPYENYQNSPYNNEGQGFGIASLVVGILSFISCCMVPIIGLIPAIAAIVLGIMGLKYPAAKGMSIAGIVLGSIGAALALGMTILFVVVMAV